MPTPSPCGCKRQHPAAVAVHWAVGVRTEQTDILFWNLDILVHTPHPASTWQPKFIRNLLQISLRKNLALSQRIFCTTPKTIRGRLLVYLSNQAAKAGSNYFEIPFDRQGLFDHLTGKCPCYAAGGD